MSGPDAQARVLRIHQWIYVSSRGFLGHRLIGVPTLLLTTIGQRSGGRRTVALVYAKARDGTFIVTASNGGADQRPGWLHNVLANESVDVQIGRRRFSCRAEVISPEHADYPALWAKVNNNTRGRYDRYQQHTQRQFELVKLGRLSKRVAVEN